MRRAIDGLSVQPTHLLIDAMTLDNALPQVSLIKVMQEVYLLVPQASWQRFFVMII